jgi:isoquinoline 1-oxidoreductase beta subunit
MSGFTGHQGFSRRGFLVVSLSAAGGLALGIRPAAADGAATELGPWIIIDPDETVTIRVAKSEVGQGVLTALPMIVAEELSFDWAKVRSEYASANRNLGLDKIYGSMGTGGSHSVRGSCEMLQQVGASARARLIAAAAGRWQVEPGDCIPNCSRANKAGTDGVAHLSRLLRRRPARDRR